MEKFTACFHVKWIFIFQEQWVNGVSFVKKSDWLMPGLCHLDRASNVKIGVECQIFVIVIFFNCSRVLQFQAHSRYYKGALIQKRYFLVICTTFISAFHVGPNDMNQTLDTCCTSINLNSLNLSSITLIKKIKRMDFHKG